MIIIDKIKHPNNIKTLIFDIDGTITQWTNVRTFLQEALNSLGIPYREESLKGWFKAMKMIEIHTITTENHDENVYAHLLDTYIEDLGTYGVSGFALKDKTFELEASQTIIDPNVPSELEALANDYVLYCYTSWFRSQALKKLSQHNLQDYFKEIYSPGNNFVKFGKTGFTYLLNNHGLKADETIHIGDSASDIIPSKKAEIHPIYLDYSITSSDNITEHKMQLIQTAEASITEFKDIRKVLTKNI